MRTAFVVVVVPLAVVCCCLRDGLAADYAEDGTSPVSNAAVKSTIMPKVAALRGLRFLTDVPVEIKTSEDVGSYVREQFDKEMPEDEIRGYERLMRHMGLLQPGVDLKEVVIKAYATHVAAYYDDEKKSFTMVSRHGAPQALDPMVAAHELTHALQDQHFDLAGLRGFLKNSDDAAMAVMALAEGDATDIMMRYLQRSPARGKGPVRDYSKLLAMNLGAQSIPGLPLVVAQDMVFPYTYGARFMATLLKQKGPDAVNAAFRDPPVSTEQIINPEKYFKRDEPYLIELPDLSEVLPEGWGEVGREPLGQFNLGIFLAVHLGSWEIDQTVEPWAGDVIAGWAGPGPDDFLFAYYSTWDSPAGAAKFFAVAGRLVEARFPALEVVCREETLSTWTGNGCIYYLRRSGADVLLIEKAPRRMAGEVVMRLWQAKKVPFGVARPIADRDRIQPGQPSPRE